MPSGRSRLQDVGLQGVGVLVLVDEHVVEAVADPGAAGGVDEQAAPEQQQVVVVEHAAAPPWRPCSAAKSWADPLGVLQAPRERRVQHLVRAAAAALTQRE